MNAPAYLYFYILTTMSIAIVVIIVGFNKILSRADWLASERRFTVGAFSVLLIGWFLVASLLHGQAPMTGSATGHRPFSMESLRL
jgi:uncharacterized membrane protein